MNTEIFKITREMVQNAKTYMPIGIKEGLAQQIAEQSITEIEPRKTNTPAVNAIRGIFTLPPLLGENVKLKKILLLSTLLSYYFGIDITKSAGKDETLNGNAAYDAFNSGNVLKQIEQYKHDSELKGIAGLILNDFKEFRKMTDAEIHNLRAANNDPLFRLSSAQSLFATPEKVQNVLDEILKKIDGVSNKNGEKQNDKN